MSLSMLPLDCLYQGLSLNRDAIAAEDEYEKLSYDELVQRVEALAHGLQQRCLVGSHIGLCALNHVDHLVAYLAILVGGFVWVPINPKNGQQLNERLIAKSDLALLLIDKETAVTLDMGDRVAIDTLSLNADTGESCRQLIDQYRNVVYRPIRPKAGAPMAIKFTGGTTGEPKGVVQSHHNVVAVIENMQKVFDFDNCDTNVAVAPITHGGSHYILSILAVGGRHILISQPSPEKILAAFRFNAASISFMPPTLIYKLLDEPGITRRDFPHLRHITYSAAPMPTERIKQAIKLFGPRLSTVYGQTEAPMTITALTSKEMENIKLRTSVGRACLHSEVAIIDDSGERLPDGETGEIAVRGDIVMDGYYKDSDMTRAVFRDGWLLTGDVGYQDRDSYIFLRGRSKELIITGGFNVYPAEVENLIVTINGVLECAVVGIEDSYWGERIEAFVCLYSGCVETEQSIQNQIKPRLGSVKTPKKIHVVDKLPRNAVGKVVRRDLVAMIEGDVAGAEGQ